MKLFLILGNQLFNPKHLKQFTDCTFYMSEDNGLCTYQKHHKLKILLFLSAMRSYRDELKSRGLKVIYNDCSKKFKTSYEKKLASIIKEKKVKEVNFFEIEDIFFEKKLKNFFEKNKILFNEIESPMFLTSREDFKNYLKKTKKPFMANFYKINRSKLNILMEKDGSPEGGKWSFDEENRNKLPNNVLIPVHPKFNETKHTIDLKGFIEREFKTHPGSTKNFWFPTTRVDSIKLLDHFLKNKINLFGDYEDAVSKKSNILFHSALSPIINIGLITPMEIIEKAKKIQKKTKINSYEGYIRQVIGWREFMRGIYQNYNSHMENSNFFVHKKKMKLSWYNGTTGLEPLDYSIKNALEYGWSHHIERLMILANVMNLCQIHPKQVYKWFMEMYVDSSDWVMSPNVYGMGLFSDGGIFATKPYICGSSYFLKMMDFKKGEWCNVMDGLYWSFINRNRKFFLKNPRLSMMVRVFDKIKTDRKKLILNAASKFVKQNTL